MSFIPQEFIRKIRDKHALPDEEIQAFIAGIGDGSVSEGQIAAYAMAVYFQGLENSSQATLTKAMRDSGRVLKWDHLDGPTVEKHSTGGVGDNISLMLAPIVAAAGVYVPMISGRGLGHTGGTLDKFESIPGYNVKPDIETFQKIVKDVGCSIIGQTADLAPADAVIYGVRDVSATVESIPLITASILSKKLAAGSDYLIMDVKFGNGSFMGEIDRAIALAHNIIRVAGEAGTPTNVLLTDMDQPLSSDIGNAIEVLDAIKFLKNETPKNREYDVTIGLAAEMFNICGRVKSHQEGIELANEILTSGKGAEVFNKMIHAHGGPADIIENPHKYLKLTQQKWDIPAPKNGVVVEIDTREIGMTIVALKGGRTHPDQKIDHAVGLDKVTPLGTKLSAGDPLGVVYARSENEAQMAITKVQQAMKIGEGPIFTPPPVMEIIRGSN